jgi:hypothetical protein
MKKQKLVRPLLVRPKVKKLLKQKKNPSGNASLGNNQQMLLIKEKEEPISYSYEARIGNPKISSLSSNRDYSVRVRHSEYIMDLVTSSVSSENSSNINGFNIIKIIQNFSLTGSFPWGSSLATNFENYRFSNLLFVFKPSTSTISSGSIMLVCDFDPSDDPPSNKVSFLERKGATSGVPYRLLGYKPQVKDYNKQKSYYLRQFGQNPTTDDLKFYDCANFYLAYTGTQPSTNLGEIWVSYDVELLTPSLDQGLRQVNNIENFQSFTTNFPSLSMPYPLGKDFGLSSTLLGAFTIAGLTAFNGLNSNNYVISNKFCNKVVTLLWSCTNALTFIYPVIDLLVRSQSIKQLSPGITLINEDTLDTAEQADQDFNSNGNFSADFTSIASTNMRTLYQQGNVSGFQYIWIFSLNWPAHAALVLSPGTGTFGTTVTSCNGIVTDGLYQNTESE